MPLALIAFAVLGLVGREALETRWGLVILIFASVLNAGWGQVRLAKQDADWPRVIARVRSSLAGDAHSAELTVLTNTGTAGSVLALSLGRYLKMDLEIRTTLSGDWIAVCDSGDDPLPFSGTECQQRVREAAPSCATRSHSIGHLGSVHRALSRRLPQSMQGFSIRV